MVGNKSVCFVDKLGYDSVLPAMSKARGFTFVILTSPVRRPKM